MNGRRTALAIAFLALTTAGAASFVHATGPAKNGQIAFVRLGSGDGSSAIFVVSADGTGERKLADPPPGYRDELPDWGAGGGRILFQRCAPNTGIDRNTCVVWSASRAGTGVTRLGPACRGTPCVSDRSPVSSPDARRIAFIRNAGRSTLTVADARLRHARAIVPPGRFPGTPYAIAWSPSGRKLAVASVNDRGNAKPVGGRALYVVGVDGTGLRRVTPWALAAGDRPDWSPDGTRILFRSRSNREGAFGANLYTVRPDGTGLRQVTRIQPSHRVLPGSYSPDGRSIVFATTDGATEPSLSVPDVFVMRTDGAGMRPVTRSESWDASPDWGPRP